MPKKNEDSKDNNIKKNEDIKDNNIKKIAGGTSYKSNPSTRLIAEEYRDGLFNATGLNGQKYRVVSKDQKWFWIPIGFPFVSDDLLKDEIFGWINEIDFGEEKNET